MSYETLSEYRAKKLENIFTDTSDILESTDRETKNCIDYFNKLILNDLHSYNKGLNCWIAGGSIKDYFLYGKITKDIDIYFESRIDFERAFGHIRWNRERGSGKNINIIFENENCRKVEYTPTMSSDLEIIINPGLDVKEVHVDLIKLYSSSPEICISNFDFTVCSVAVTKDKFYYHKDFFNHLESKKLKVLNPKPENLLYRIQKYSRMGFSLDREEINNLTNRFIKLDA